MKLNVRNIKRPDPDLSDLTAARQTAPAYWDPAAVDVLVVPMDGTPTKAEQARIRRRLLTRDADEESKVEALVSARAALKGADPLNTAIRTLIDLQLRELGIDP